MLHMPMEAENAPREWLGKGGITSELDGAEVRRRISDALEQLKYAEALSNHMGSRITQNEKMLEEIVAVVKERGLIMVDSVTSFKSKVGDVAERAGVRRLKREVFLDATNGTDAASVEKHMLEAAELVKQQGYTVVIGHVGPAGGVNTAKVIARLAPRLTKEGVRFVTVKELCDILHVGGSQPS